MNRAEQTIVDTINDCVAPVGDMEEETASAVLTALANAGYSVIETRLLMSWQK